MGVRRRKRICSPVAVTFGSSKLRATGPTSNMEAELRPGTSSWNQDGATMWCEHDEDDDDAEEEEQQPLCLSNTAASHQRRTLMSDGAFRLSWKLEFGAMDDIAFELTAIQLEVGKVGLTHLLSLALLANIIAIICAWKHKKKSEGRRCTKLLLQLFNDTTSDQVVNRWCNAELSRMLNCKLWVVKVPLTLRPGILTSGGHFCRRRLPGTQKFWRDSGESTERTISFTFGELSGWSFLFCFRELWCYLTCTGII